MHRSAVSSQNLGRNSQGVSGYEEIECAKVSVGILKVYSYRVYDMNLGQNVIILS